MGPGEIERRIHEHLPEARVTIRDLTGTSDHWQVMVVSEAFRGRSMLEQHRMVKGFFEDEIESGAVHALSLKTYTPEEWKKSGGKS